MFFEMEEWQANKIFKKIKGEIIELINKHPNFIYPKSILHNRSHAKRQANNLYFDSDLISYSHLKIPTPFTTLQQKQEMVEEENNSNSDILKSPTSLKLQIQNDKEKEKEKAMSVKEGKISDFFATFDSKVADAAKNVKQIVKEMEK